MLAVVCSPIWPAFPWASLLITSWESLGKMVKMTWGFMCFNFTLNVNESLKQKNFNPALRKSSHLSTRRSVSCTHGWSKSMAIYQWKDLQKAIYLKENSWGEKLYKFKKYNLLFLNEWVLWSNMMILLVVRYVRLCSEYDPVHVAVMLHEWQ